MRNIWTIAVRDFRTYFTSPIAYIFIAAFLLIIGWMFFFNLNQFVLQNMQYQSFNQGRAISVTDGIIRPLYGNMNVILLFMIPAITMRLFAEEKKQQTIALLLTSPVKLSQIILGKFFAAFMLVFVMLLITLVYPVILLIIGNPDPGTIVACFLGTVLLVSCYIGVGVLFSSMTENQIVAWALSFCAALFLWLINWASQSAGPVLGEFLDYMSLIQHFRNFSQGILNSTDTVFYLSFLGITLFLTHRVLDSYRWR